MKLEALEITATSARMEWRHLDEQEEKPHVDGIQVSLMTLGFYSTSICLTYVLSAPPYPAGPQWNPCITRT